MKTILQLFSIFLLLCSCCNEVTKKPSENLLQSKYLINHKQGLPNGTFYAKEWRHTDTIVLVPCVKTKRRAGGWTELYWAISNDMIEHKDANGFAYFLHKDKSTYRIENDTLTLTFKKKDQANQKFNKSDKDLEEQFKTLQISDTLIVLVKIHGAVPETYNWNGFVMTRGGREFSEDGSIITSDIHIK